MPEPSPFRICRVQTPEGMKDYVTVFPPDLAISRGLPPESIIGVLTRPLTPGEQLAPAAFAPNSVFVDYLHGFLAREVPKLPAMLAEARRQSTGWVYVVDRRTPQPSGTVPPEDVLGGFEVKDGQVISDSYRRNPNHRILSDKGFFRLAPELHAALVAELSNLPRPGPP